MSRYGLGMGSSTTDDGIFEAISGCIFRENDGNKAYSEWVDFCGPFGAWSFFRARFYNVPGTVLLDGCGGSLAYLQVRWVEVDKRRDPRSVRRSVQSLGASTEPRTQLISQQNA